MYSCDYEIFWLTYDDYNHGFTVPETGLTPGVTMPMKLEQKLLISFPEEPVLMRESDAKISNNFTSYSLMAGVAISGVREETQLVRYRQNISNVNNVGLYMLDVISDGEDIYGSGGILKCPAQGKATFFVANTVRGLNADAGLIFLDYIRLVPKVDPND